MYVPQYCTCTSLQIFHDKRFDVIQCTNLCFMIPKNCISLFSCAHTAEFPNFISIGFSLYSITMQNSQCLLVRSIGQNKVAFVTYRVLTRILHICTDLLVISMCFILSSHFSVRPILTMYICMTFGKTFKTDGIPNLFSLHYCTKVYII